MKRIIKWSATFAAIVILFYISLKEYSSVSKMGDARDIIEKVYSYKANTGDYPESLQDIGADVSEAGPFYYQKEDDGESILWFGESLGDSKTYYFEKMKWK